MNISLTQELESYVQQKVQSGNYHSASEVIREGLRLLQEQDAMKETRLAALREEIMIGVEAIREGRYTICRNSEELDQLFAGIKAEGLKKLAETEKRA